MSNDFMETLADLVVSKFKTEMKLDDPKIFQQFAQSGKFIEALTGAALTTAHTPPVSTLTVSSSRSTGVEAKEPFSKDNTMPQKCPKTSLANGTSLLPTTLINSEPVTSLRPDMTAETASVEKTDALKNNEPASAFEMVQAATEVLSSSPTELKPIWNVETETVSTTMPKTTSPVHETMLTSTTYEEPTEINEATPETLVTIKETTIAATTSTLPTTTATMTRSTSTATTSTTTTGTEMDPPLTGTTEVATNTSSVGIATTLTMASTQTVVIEEGELVVDQKS